MSSTARKLVLQDPPTSRFIPSMDSEKPSSLNEESHLSQTPQHVVDLESGISDPRIFTPKEASPTNISDARRASDINRAKEVCQTFPSLHTDVNTHCFWTGNVSSMKGIGNHIICSQWYSHLGDEVRSNITRCGFGEFVKILGLGKPDIMLVHALAERWWDTTHSFHFDNIGELTLTPTDFSALTGLPIAGKQLWLDHDAVTKDESIRRMFGKEMVVLARNEGVISCNDLFEEYANFPHSTKKEVDQLTRVFLLALIGSVICTDKSGALNLKLMNCLEHIEYIGSYNWGGAALASMYKNMNSLSRAAQTTGCMWQLWEAWARHYIIPLSNIPVVGQISWPRAIESIGVHSFHASGTNQPLQDYRDLLTHLRVDKVAFHPWGSLDGELPDYVRKSMDIASKRVLLHCPSGYAWYLGERVNRQVVVDCEPFVPVHPPTNMLDNCHFTEAEITGWTVGVDGTTLSATTDLSYDEFVEKFIKYPDYRTHKAEPETSEDIVGISEIRIPPWQLKVPVGDDDNVFHAIDIPRDTPSPYLPLLQHVKAVTADTATTLLRQIAGLSSIASRQTLKDTLLKSAEYKNEILRRQLDTAENKIVELTSMFNCEGPKPYNLFPHFFQRSLPSGTPSFNEAGSQANNEKNSDDCRSFGAKAIPARCNDNAKDIDEAWDLTPASCWSSKAIPNPVGLTDTKRMKTS